MKTTIETTRLKFPGVTICNINPLINSKAKQDAFIYRAVQKVSSFLQVPLETFEYKDGGTISNETLTFQGADFLTDDPLDESILEFQLELQSLPYDMLDDMSQEFSKFVISCDFGGVVCDSTNFTKVYDKNYGLCYTFINTTENSEGILVYNAGPIYGLKLILNVDQKEYLPFLTTSAGVRIQIHEFGSTPHLQELGQSISTGFETQIGVRPKIFKRLPAPYGTCDDSGQYENVLDCEKLCLEKYTREHCLCSRLSEDVVDMTMKICSGSEIPCVQEVTRRKAAGLWSCEECRSTCRVYDFNRKVSMTRWPADHYDPAVQFKLKKWASMEQVGMLTPDESRSNLLTMTVYYSELSLQTTEEEPGYTWESLLSDIGGQLGLWLGISVLSMCEVIELFYLMLKNLCKPASKVSDVIRKF